MNRLSRGGSVDGQWTLHGATTSYVVRVPDHGRWAELVAWGPDDFSVGRVAPVGEVHFLTEADAAPLEYAVRGVRYANPTELVVGGPAGSDECRPTFVEAAQSGDTLELTFVDELWSLRLVLHYRMRADLDVIERWVSVHIDAVHIDAVHIDAVHIDAVHIDAVHIDAVHNDAVRNDAVRNDGSELTLHEHASAGFVVPTANGAVIRYLWGEWNREFQQSSITMPRGRFTIDSRQGITGHSYSPFLSVSDAEDPTGTTWGVQLAWSGSWQLAADVDTTGQTRIQAGRVPSSRGLALSPGESWVSPVAVGACSAEGPDGLARAFHAYQRSQAGERLGLKRRVLYNSWFATEFDVRAEHQLELARKAADVGAELFVVDDGWFVGRKDDTAGLGDWDVDPAAFPDGLDVFIKDLKELGLDFGLWVEPESVSPTSELATKHPEWILRTEGREPLLVRNQLLLDLSRDDVADWIWATLDHLLTTYEISYLKWDANRSRLDAGDQRRDLDGAVVTNLYKILDRLRSDHEGVFVEGCAGGGARVDAGMAARVDTLWPSDNTAPLDRLTIQRGFLSGYAPHLMSSWVTDAEGTHDRRERSLDFRFHVAMAGGLGIGADLSKWSGEQLATARAHVAQYKQIRDVVAHGKVYWLGPAALRYVGANKSVVFRWDTGDGDADSSCVVVESVD